MIKVEKRHSAAISLFVNVINHRMVECIEDYERCYRGKRLQCAEMRDLKCIRGKIPLQCRMLRDILDNNTLIRL